MSTKKGICLMLVVVACFATSAIASEGRAVVANNAQLEPSVLTIDRSELWKDDGTLFISFAQKSGDPDLLEIVELESFADRTEFWGYYQGEVVDGRLELVTSAAETQGAKGAVDAVNTLRIEILNGEKVTKKQIRWSEPAAVAKQTTSGGSQPAGGVQAAGGVRLSNRFMLAEMAQLAIKECKCSTGYIYLCPDGDCDTSEDCNNDTGICEEYIIHEAS